MSPSAAPQAVDRSLTKPPAEWANYMVAAALKCALDDQLSAIYASPDFARFHILNVLNALEVRGEYTWPDFSSLQYDFDQVMRLRRTLVQNVFVALERAGVVRVGMPRAPERNIGSRPANRANHKRVCRREARSSEDAMSEYSDGGHGAFLLQAMTELVNRSQLELDGYLQDQGCRDPRKFADVVHDKLIEVWTEPQRETGDVSEVLRRKAEVWACPGRGQSPRPREVERVSTPRNQQISSDTVRKPLDASASAPRAVWDKPGGWTDANQQEQEWADTNTIG